MTAAPAPANVVPASGNPVKVQAVPARVPVAVAAQVITNLQQIVSRETDPFDSVVISVTNKGSKAASTTCAVAQAPSRVGAPIQVVQTPLIEPGATVQFTAVVTKLGTALIPLAADCSSP